jgi:hypothetical protein
LAVVFATPAAARTDNKSKAVLFIHGYNPTSTSTDCGGDFDAMISQMRSQGFTGPMVKVGFYSGDKNCNVNLRSYGTYGDRDSWKQIGQCAALKPGSTDLNWLNQNGNPQGRFGTEFTTIGSNGDSVVPASSAAYMSIPSTNKVTYSSVPHTGSTNYMKNSTVITRSGNALAYVNQ